MSSSDLRQALDHSAFYDALFRPNGDYIMRAGSDAVDSLTSNTGEAAPSLAVVQQAYGIVNPADLPKQSYTARTLSHLNRVSKWGTTGEFQGVNGAKDHCGATAGFNLIQYYRYRYGHAGMMLSTRRATFTEMHKNVGNGPLVFNALLYGWTGKAGIRRYVNDRGYKFGSYATGGYSGIKSQIDANCGVIVLIVGGFTKWHYVNAVGWRSYSGGAKFVRIVDNWNDSYSKFLRTGNIVGSYKTHIY